MAGNDFSMKIRGTDFVMYHVSDLARAVAFYRDVLGLPLEVYSEQYHWAELNCGNVTLALRGGMKPSRGTPAARIALGVADIHSAYEELKAKGVRTSGAPQDHAVCWHLEVFDPDGRIVILHQRVDGTAG